MKRMLGSIKHLILIAISHVFIGDGATDLQRYTLRRNDYRTKFDIVTHEVGRSSLVACTAYCDHDTACLTVSYNKAEGRCIMSTTRVTNPVAASNLLVSESGWVTISKAVYKVFHVKSELGQYEATFAEAATLCAEYQTVVASPAELLESRALGLSHCACGWLSDGTNGFVIQTANSLCWHKFNKKILYCNNAKANVWCRL